MLPSSRSLRPLCSRASSSSLQAGAAAGVGGAPAGRLPLHRLPALRVACRASAGGSQPPDRSGWTDPEKLEAMAARLLAAKQAGAGRSANGAGGQPGPRATAPSGPAQPGSSSSATKPAEGGYGGPVAQDVPKRPNPLALLGQALLFILLLPIRLVGGVLRAAFVLLEVAFKTALLLVQIPIFVVATLLHMLSLASAGYGAYVALYSAVMLGKVQRGAIHATLWTASMVAKDVYLYRPPNTHLWLPVIPGHYLSLERLALLFFVAYFVVGVAAGFLARLTGMRSDGWGPAAAVGQSIAEL